MSAKTPKIVLAPMAGITDRPFRTLCRRLGADETTSEMVSANPALRNTDKSRLRLDYRGEDGKRIVQIAGADPVTLAEAARYNVDQGADIIDINMGCPAKKVCNVMAGSALLKDEKLVGKILETVVNAVPVPVTVKIRTGTDPENRSGVTIANIAEASGIQSIAVHGRTRACAFKGEAEYDTIREIKHAVSIPVYANGDIDSPEKAQEVLNYTGADGIMIGRAAQGYPWIFREIKQFLETGKSCPRPSPEETKKTILEHLTGLYGFYGEFKGVKIARKHVRWYLQNLLPAPKAKNAWQRIAQVDTIAVQLESIRNAFEEEAMTTKTKAA